MSMKNIYLIRGYENFLTAKSEFELCYWIQLVSKKWFWKQIFDQHGTDILEGRCTLVLLSHKCEIEESLAMVVCALIGIPIIWEGPLSQLNKAEIDFIRRVDVRHSSYEIPHFNESANYVTFEGDVYSSDFTLENPAKYTPSMPPILVSPQYFISHWFELSPFNGIPPQSLLIFPQIKKESKAPNLEMIQQILLYFLEIAGLTPKNRLDEAFLLLLQGYGYDYSAIQMLLEGPKPNQLSDFLSRVHGIASYQVLSYSACFPHSGKIMVSFEHGEKSLHKFIVFHSTFKCSCESDFCPAVLIFLKEINCPSSIDSTRWGLLSNLITSSIVRISKRKYNPRNFKEAFFADESSNCKYELTQLGKKMLVYRIPHSKYFEILDYFNSTEIVDDHNFIIESICKCLGFPKRSMAFSNYSSEGILELARDLSFKYGLHKAFKELKSIQANNTKPTRM